MILIPTLALPLTLKASGAVVEMGQSFDHRLHHSFELYAIVVPRNDHAGRPVHGEWMLSTEISLHGWGSMGKVLSVQRPSSARAVMAPQGRALAAPGGSRRPGRVRPGYWAPLHCLSCSSQPPRTPPIPPPLTV